MQAVNDFYLSDKLAEARFQDPVSFERVVEAVMKDISQNIDTVSNQFFAAVLLKEIPYDQVRSTLKDVHSIALNKVNPTLMPLEHFVCPALSFWSTTVLYFFGCYVRKELMGIAPLLRDDYFTTGYIGATCINAVVLANYFACNALYNQYCFAGNVVEEMDAVRQTMKEFNVKKEALIEGRQKFLYYAIAMGSQDWDCAALVGRKLLKVMLKDS